MSTAKTDLQSLQRFRGKWETKLLGDIASIRNHKVLPSNVNASTPCVELEHIGSGNGQLLERAIAENSTSSKYRFLAGDVLFGRLRSYLRKFWLADQDGICTTEIWPLMGDPKQLDNGFLHAIVQSDQFFAMANISYGTHMPRADWGVIGNLPIMLPGLQEQRAIAEVLSDVDGLFNALEALIAKKQAIKQAVMQQLLTGRTRLQGFSGAWETKRLGDLFSIRAGSSKSQYIRQGGRYIIVDMGAVAIDGRLIVSKYTDYEGDFLKEGDLVMPKDDIGGGKIIGKVAYINANNLYVLGDHVYALRLIEGFPKFFSYLINRYETNSSLKSKVGGSAQLGLSRKAVEEQEVPVPTREEQHAITSVLFDMDAEIVALERRRDKTRAIKQGMMQQLLTGQVRLFKTKCDAEVKT